MVLVEVVGGVQEQAADALDVGTRSANGRRLHPGPRAARGLGAVLDGPLGAVQDGLDGTAARATGGGRHAADAHDAQVPARARNANTVVADGRAAAGHVRAVAVLVSHHAARALKNAIARVVPLDERGRQVLVVEHGAGVDERGDDVRRAGGQVPRLGRLDDRVVPLLAIARVVGFDREEHRPVRVRVAIVVGAAEPGAHGRLVHAVGQRQREAVGPAITTDNERGDASLGLLAARHGLLIAQPLALPVDDALGRHQHLAAELAVAGRLDERAEVLGAGADRVVGHRRGGQANGNKDGKGPKSGTATINTQAHAVLPCSGMCPSRAPGRSRGVSCVIYEQKGGPDDARATICPL